MADTPESLLKLAKLLNEQSEVYLTLQGTVTSLDKALEDYNKSLKAGEKEQEKYFVNQSTVNKLIRDNMKDQQRLKNAYNSGTISVQEYNEGIEKSNKLIQDTIEKLPPEYIDNARAQLTFTKSLMTLDAFINNTFVKSLTSFSATLITSAFSAKTGLDMSIDTTKSAFDAMFKIATSTAGAIPVAGGYIKEGLKAVGEAGKQVLDFYGNVTKQISGAFKSATSAGFVFADGLTGLKNAASDAGLTTELFAKALTEHRESVQQFGGSLTEGAKRIGRVTKELNIDRLQQLGYSLDEIPGLIAEVGARMRRSGSVTDAEVARQTVAYAQNLKIIAELTGQDAKTLQQKAEQNEKDLAFQQFLASKTPEEAEKIRQQMAVLPAASQELFKEMAQTGGQIFSESGNILAQQAPAIAEMARRFFDQVNAGTVDASTSVNILKDLGPVAAEEIKNNTKAFGTAAAVLQGTYGEVGQKLAETYKMLAPLADGKTIEDIIKNAQKQVEEAGSADEKSKELREAERLGMSLQVDIQNKVVDSLEVYLSIVNDTTEGVAELVTGITEVANTIKKFKDSVAVQTNIISKREEKNTVGTEAGSVVGTAGGIVAGAEAGGLAGAAIGSVVPVLGTAIGGAIGAALGAAVGGYFGNEAGKDVGSAISETLSDWWTSMTGHAEGGILTGPDTGYMAKLHGTEAILPPDLTEMLMDVAQNKSSFNNQDIMSQVMGAISAPANQQTDLMQTLISKVDQLIDATKDVATYAERTSVRVA
jgi:uncharacterized membrane protein